MSITILLLQRVRASLMCGVAAAAILAGASGAQAGLVTDPTNTGPSSSALPYLVPTASGWTATSLLTVGDAVTNADTGGLYRMVGIPDGMGAYDNGDGTITLLVNHEIGSNNLGVPLGSTRAHGAAGAFVSQWTINKNTLAVLSGRDLATSVVTGGSTTISRLCSADLPAQSAFYNAATGKGYDGRIFMNGEESGAEGRAFGFVVSERTAFELPALGNFSWENSLAAPFAQDKTVVIGTDDTTPGQVYLYVGAKTDTGSAVEKAGLTNGQLFGIAAPDFTNGSSTNEDPATATRKAAFSLVALGDVSGTTGATLQTESVTGGVTEFLRPEDGAWDTQSPNTFYFVTTASFNGPSRLWKMTFDDITNPQLGGQIEMLLDGTEGQRMFDNMTVAADGTIYIQEDVGSNARLGKIWRYDPTTGSLEEIFEHDPDRFLTGAPEFLTQDEESSGIIDVTYLFTDAKWYRGGQVFLADVQAHYRLADTELVEGGQLVLLYNGVPEPGTLGLLGGALLGLGALRRRRAMA